MLKSHSTRLQLTTLRNWEQHVKAKSNHWCYLSGDERTTKSTAKKLGLLTSILLGKPMGEKKHTQQQHLKPRTADRRAVPMDTETSIGEVPSLGLHGAAVRQWKCIDLLSEGTVEQALWKYPK